MCCRSTSPWTRYSPSRPRKATKATRWQKRASAPVGGRRALSYNPAFGKAIRHGRRTTRRSGRAPARRGTRAGRQGEAQDLLRHGGGGREDLLHAQGGGAAARRRHRRGHRLSREPPEAGNGRACRRPRGGAAHEPGLPRQDPAGDGRRRGESPKTRALPRGRARAHQCPGRAKQETLPGRPGAHRGRHRRLYNGERPAPGGLCRHGGGDHRHHRDRAHP